MKNLFMLAFVSISLTACVPSGTHATAPQSPEVIARGFAAEACAKKGVKPATDAFQACVTKSAPAHMKKAHAFYDQQMAQHHQQRQYQQRQQQQAIVRALLAPAPVHQQPVYQIVPPPTVINCRSSTSYGTTHTRCQY
jgi:hypothetical protein